MSSNSFNPNSTEAQYGLQMACYLVHRYQPCSVRLCVNDPDIALAAVQRLAWLGEALVVDHEELREKVKKISGLRLGLADQKVEPDVALMLFSRKAYADPPPARHMVLLDKNALSYKSFLYPGQIQDNVIVQLRWFQQMYELNHRIGLFGPRFLFQWLLALMAGSRRAPMHFQFGQQALDRIYTSTGVWWTGYMIVLSGDRYK